MNDFNHTFSKFMSDIIDSGVWATLSPASRTLYPVLLKYSDETFKEVWPGTDELLRMTGFKTKKSLQEARRELRSLGLIDIVPGSGRSSTRYYFRFDYPGSRINLTSYRDTIRSRRGLEKYPPAGATHPPPGDTQISPNQIHIHINQDTQKQDQILSDMQLLLKQYLGKEYIREEKDFRSQLISEMLGKYGNLEVGEAIKIAISRGKSGDIKYLEGILKNRNSVPQKMTNSNQAKFALNPQEPFSDPELEFWREQLQYRYTVGGTIFFQSNSQVPKEDIEKAFREKGISVRIFQKKPGNAQEMPKVFKFS